MGREVRRMFDGIAPHYDRANRVLSLGLDRRWRRRAVDLAQAPKGGSVLDVATGTGDLAFLFRKAVGHEGRVVGVDFSPPMLVRARQKADELGREVEFREADAMRLPFPDASFDVASIGFGIRNVDDPARCLAEMARVVRTGGRVLVLEFGQPRGLLKVPYGVYSRLALPVVGGLLTGRPSAYRYLGKSAASFPAADRFVELVEKTGLFVDTVFEALSGGIAYAYVSVVGPRAQS